MDHPRRFDPDDPLLARLRAIALALPEAKEKLSHGHPAFFTTKMFCWFGGQQKVDGQWIQREHSVLIIPTQDERPALLEDPRVYLPAYFAPSGWIGLDLDTDTDWTEIAELVEDSFRLTATARAIRALDARAHTTVAEQ